jgi:hypothetical protein
MAKKIGAKLLGQWDRKKRDVKYNPNENSIGNKRYLSGRKIRYVRS